ncbi:19301_t:CDS:2, partial [Entrophospora sp. SA101]
VKNTQNILQKMAITQTRILPDEQDSDQDTIMSDIDDVTEIDDVEELTDDQIIEVISEETVAEINNPEEEYEEEIAVISNMEALEKIIRYCKNPPDNFNIKMEELKAFNSVKEKVKILIRKSTLDSYINM